MRASGAAISRGRFLSAAAALAAACASGARRFSGPFDWILRGAKVFDGRGGAPFQCDIGLSADRIAALGDLSHASARNTLSLAGLAVAPGFIDLHSHSDVPLLQDGRGLSKLMQGVTTELLGQDGRSLAPLNDSLSVQMEREMNAAGVTGARWRSFGELSARYEKAGLAINVAFLVGAGQLRRVELGDELRPTAPLELARMTAAARTARGDGVFGLSSGLEYPPGAYATRNEVSALARQLGLYITHMRNEDDRVLEALDEALHIAGDAGAALHISHLKAQGRRNWPKQTAMLDRLDRGRLLFRRISCDAYPYNAYNVRLSSLLPVWARLDPRQSLAERLRSPELRARMAAGFEEKIVSLDAYNAVMLANLPHGRFRAWEGQRLGTLAAEIGRPPFEIVAEILSVLGDRATMIGFAMSEENVRALLAYRWCAIASDGAALSYQSGGRPHPRNFGAFPRAIRYARDEGVGSLSEMVRKMTSLPAQILGIEERGSIEVGKYADLCIFEEQSFRDRGDYLNPAQKPDGLAHVFVNGRLTIRNGELAGERGGRVIRRQTA